MLNRALKFYVSYMWMYFIIPFCEIWTTWDNPLNHWYIIIQFCLRHLNVIYCFWHNHYGWTAIDLVSYFHTINFSIFCNFPFSRIFLPHAISLSIAWFLLLAQKNHWFNFSIDSFWFLLSRFDLCLTTYSIFNIYFHIFLFESFPIHI